MFYGQCWKCGERWELGTASTCTCEPEQLNTYEDDEFNRIEMESRVRQEYVRQQMKKLQDEIPAAIPFVTQEDWEEIIRNS